METKKKVSSREVSDKWFVRVDGEKEFLRQKCLDMAKSSEYAILHAIFHVGSKKENPHVHFIIQREKAVQKQAFDNGIKKLFGVAGTQYSTKLWDGEYKGAGSYLYHEEDENKPAEVLASKGIEEIHVVTMRECAKEWRATIQEKKAKASVTLVQKAVAYFNTPDNEGKLPDKPTTRRIWNYMCDLCRRGENYFPGENVLKKYVVEALIQVGTEASWEKYVSNAFDRAFPVPWEERNLYSSS